MVFPNGEIILACLARLFLKSFTRNKTSRFVGMLRLLMQKKPELVRFSVQAMRTLQCARAVFFDHVTDKAGRRAEFFEAARTFQPAVSQLDFLKKLFQNLLIR